VVSQYINMFNLKLMRYVSLGTALSLSLPPDPIEQSSSLQANMSSTRPVIPSTVWNRKVLYCIHKDPPPVSILSQINPLHTSPFHYLKNHFNIILLSMPKSSRLSLCLRSAHHNALCTFWYRSNKDRLYIRFARRK